MTTTMIVYKIYINKYGKSRRVVVAVADPGGGTGSRRVDGPKGRALINIRRRVCGHGAVGDAGGGGRGSVSKASEKKT